MDAPVFFLRKKPEWQVATVRNTLRSALYCSMIIVSIFRPSSLGGSEPSANEIVPYHQERRKQNNKTYRRKLLWV